MARTPQARDLMSRPVRQLTSRTPMRDAAAFLLRHGISGAPVIDEHGRWIGVFTQNDLARYVQHRILAGRPARTLESRESVGEFPKLSLEKFGETPVREFMTAGLYTVFPDATLEEVVHTMTAFKIHRVFVIDQEFGRLQGVITSMDLLRVLDRPAARSSRKRKLARN